MARSAVPTLWTPDRDIPLHTRGIQTATPQQMAVIRAMHDIAQQLNIEIRCPKCDKSFGGLNGGQAHTESIFCGCREIRAVVRESGIVEARNY